MLAHVPGRCFVAHIKEAPNLVDAPLAETLEYMAPALTDILDIRHAAKEGIDGRVPFLHHSLFHSISQGESLKVF